MAWLSETSTIGFGKYKGKKISEIQDAAYIKWLHESDKNIYFKKEVLDRLHIQTVKTKNQWN